LAAVVGAALVGKRIRKNPGLQAASSVAIAFTPLPITWAGGATLSESLLLVLPLGVAYLAGTFCVRAVLERARRNPQLSRLAGLISVLVPAGAATILYFVAGPLAAAALAVTTAYCLIVFSASPSAKRLKLIGLTISFAHAATGLFLVF
jgi:hypothetical protein